LPKNKQTAKQINKPEETDPVPHIMSKGNQGNLSDE